MYNIWQINMNNSNMNDADGGGESTLERLEQMKMSQAMTVLCYKYPDWGVGKDTMMQNLPLDQLQRHQTNASETEQSNRLHRGCFDVFIQRDTTSLFTATRRLYSPRHDVFIHRDTTSKSVYSCCSSVFFVGRNSRGSYNKHILNFLV